MPAWPRRGPRSGGIWRSTTASGHIRAWARGRRSKPILTATIWVSDIRNRALMNEAWSAWADPKNLPARACIEAKMADPRCLVEIQVVAAK